MEPVVEPADMPPPDSVNNDALTADQEQALDTDFCVTTTGPVNTPSKGKILFLITEDWFFCLHRLPVARMLRDQGWDVVVVTRVVAHGDIIQREGFRIVPMDWERHSLSPLRGLQEMRTIDAIYRNESPDLIHQIAVKPCVYGGIVALRHATIPVLNNLAGLGVAFTSSGWRSKLLRQGLLLAFRALFKRSNTQTVVENPDDKAVLTQRAGLPPDSITLTQGVGVDLELFTMQAEPTGTPVVTLASRMIKPKGIQDLIEAVRILKRRNIQIRVQLLGLPDPDNPASISEIDLQRWQQETLIEWHGYTADMVSVWQQTNIAILPSYYREGIPRSLLEAAACGRALIATDIPGCRDIVIDGSNGLLVPVHAPQAIADAIQRLAAEPDTRHRMGLQGRRRVEQHFSEQRVLQQMQQVYARLLGPLWPSSEA